MADAEQRPTVAIGISLALSALIALVWVLQLAALSSLAGSDAAGNALSQAYTAIIVIALWALLVILAIIAAAKGRSPKWALIAALVLIPASCFATFVALDLLSHPFAPPYRWPLITPALVPPLVVMFCLWALLPLPNRMRWAPAAVWSAVALLCLTLVPLAQMRVNVVEQQMEQREIYARDFAAMPPNAPLWEWTPFLNTQDNTRVADTLERIKRLDNRQGEAEIMLARGDFPFNYLGSFDLTPDASLCAKARAALRSQAEGLVLTKPKSVKYQAIGAKVSDAVSALSWLIGYDCPAAPEAQAWLTTAESYDGSNFDLVRLRELQDPKEFGRIVRSNPERFSMLNERSHLKAWLKFAEQDELREQALTGARRSDHRIADAVEMLRDKYDIAAPWKALRYLPVLDLQATPALCSAALSEIRAEMAKTYRPKSGDEPRPYSELLSRLGNDAAQLPALQWLAAHDCDAEAALTEAEAMITAYQDSPARAAMLASLAALHRK